ncbi:MAG: YHS domain-containing protein [Proteobacteria bacterium]|nr:YHS domain-containing protein [Pseudomonadota bacterium]
MTCRPALFLRRIVPAVFLTVALAGSASAREPEIYTGLVASTAAAGYDVVAYFTDAKPVAGRKDLTYQWKGVTWRFASEKNRDAFKAKPEAYAPQYGGYCAWAVSQGITAKGDPKFWKVVDGKLYLNYDARVQKDWERDIPGNIVKADKNWPAALAN